MTPSYTENGYSGRGATYYKHPEMFQVLLSLKNIPFPNLNLNQEYSEQG